MMDLDPENDVIVLGFEYSLSFFSLLKFLKRKLKSILSRQELEKSKKILEYEEKLFMII
ncbi:MAG: hypothetical protein U5K71_09245 [Gracilimonas sp.]|nr:hypothetical protein [Gracilimonas sp.]